MAIASTSSVKDQTYYFDVDGTGFKVSRRLFANHPPILAKLLQANSSVPHESSNYRLSIRHPILLYGHTADQFSLFLHALTLTSLPHPLELLLEDLISVAELAHLYDASSLKIWALNGLTPAIMLAARDQSQTTVLSSDFFTRVLRVALACDDSRLANMAQSGWTDRIHRCELPPAPAILLADKHNLVLLQIHAYYAQLLLAAPFVTGSGSLPAHNCPSLNASQRTHLLEGYHSIRSYWNHLRDNAPTFPQSPGCTDHDHRICISSWKTRWTVMAEWPLQCQEVDVLRRFAFMGKSLEKDRTLELCMNSGCRDLAFAMLRAKLKELGENLWHHFDL